MANRFGDEYRGQHNGSDPLRMPAPMKRKPYERLNEDYNPQIRPQNNSRDIAGYPTIGDSPTRRSKNTHQGSWISSQLSYKVSNPHSNDDVVLTNVEDGRSKGPKQLSSMPYQADDERGSYIQKGANKKYNFEKKNNKYTEDEDNKKDKPNDKDSGGGSKVPRKPKPNTPSGGLKKPTPTKASK